MILDSSGRRIRGPMDSDIDRSAANLKSDMETSLFGSPEVDRVRAFRLAFGLPVDREMGLSGWISTTNRDS